MFFSFKSKNYLLFIIASLLILLCLITGCSQNSEKSNLESKSISEQNLKTNGEQTKTAWEPTEEVEIVVHNSPGSSTDGFARVVANALNKNGIVKQKIVINNRPGGGGRVAREYLYSQAGNPHVLAALSETYISRGFLNSDDIAPTEFTPIALQIGDPTTVIVNNDSPYKTMNEILEDARNRPGQVSQGSGAVGAGEWILARLIENKANVKFNFVSFQTGGESIVAILGGHVDFGLANPNQIIEHIKAGNLRVLAIGTEERVPLFPDVPTLKELGVDVVNYGLRGWLAAPDITNEQKEFWINAMKEVMQTSEMQEYINNNLLVDVFCEDDEFTNFMINFWEEREQLFREAEK